MERELNRGQPAVVLSDPFTDRNMALRVIGVLYAIVEDLRELDLRRCESAAHGIIDELASRYRLRAELNMFEPGDQNRKR